ncbi:3-oxoacid CoA-transferase subunit B [Aquabacter sediminis]|uniref:3-oxoacid CoA-transferase subunit B n=1 Tax=Aquabacter sediminis TaxID=3029197 RepID=UPI00237EA6FA|nr:3-oxoacid CoA-transferase subunit B [Aquabacter sp. P-9]MDE1569970.1 3-oxoacid CoA-transferase subunit B [Aquabacter sp. P-9]
MSSSTFVPWTRVEMAKLIARDIPEGAVVNIGIGMPGLVADHLPADREILLHAENGILGMGPKPGDNAVDMDLINAGKEPVTLLEGGAFFDHMISFSMMRGGHLDIAVLGAFQVAENGDLANWATNDANAIPAVGGAMDLAVGASNVFVMMELLTKKGESKLVHRCTYPLTGLGCVNRVYTDHAVLDIDADGFVLRELAPGLTLDELKARTGLEIRAA